MVGGTVIETLPCVVDGEARVWLNVRERPCYHEGQRIHGGGRECAVYVEDSPAARSVSEGDSLWWQGGHAFWTPRAGGFEDYKLRRVGCSGVARPGTGPRWCDCYPYTVQQRCRHVAEGARRGLGGYCGKVFSEEAPHAD